MTSAEHTLRKITGLINIALPTASSYGVLKSLVMDVRELATSSIVPGDAGDLAERAELPIEPARFSQQATASSHASGPDIDGIPFGDPLKGGLLDGRLEMPPSPIPGDAGSLAGQGEPFAQYRDALQRLHSAIHALSKFEGNKTLFEASLYESDRALAAWQELNGAQVQAATALAQKQAAPRPAAQTYTLVADEGGTFLQAEAGQLFICADINTVCRVLGAIGAPPAQDADRGGKEGAR